MKKSFAILLFCTVLIAPVTLRAAQSPRPEGDTPSLNENWQSNPNTCLAADGTSYYCRANVKHKADKKHDTTTIVVVSVATAAVFAGAMYYFFKKRPSENNPGQVKFAEF